MSRLDVVVFGASGFTGMHATEQLARLAERQGITWAVAGRNREKLYQVLQEVSHSTGFDLSSVPVLIADVQDESALRIMCARARVLASCCGPYTLYGEAVVNACILSGTHYVDVTAEPHFIESMQLKYGSAARDAGVFIVNACGFESIPADLGVIYLQEKFEGVLNSVECYVAPEIPDSSVNFGTWHSVIHILSHLFKLGAVRKELYPKPLPEFIPKLKYRFPLHRRFGGWCIPIPCIDSAIVYHTQRFFYERDGTRPVQFKTYVKFSSVFTALAIAFTIAFVFIMAQFKLTTDMLLKNYRKFSLGLIAEAPSEEVVNKVGFEYILHGKGWDKKDAAEINSLAPNKTMIAKVSGTNPGYGMTVIALLYSAVAILEEQHNILPRGGVLTPGIAFAKTNLVKNLQDNGVNFEIIHSKVHRD